MRNEPAPCHRRRLHRVPGCDPRRGDRNRDGAVPTGPPRCSGPRCLYPVAQPPRTGPRGPVARGATGAPGRRGAGVRRHRSGQAVRTAHGAGRPVLVRPAQAGRSGHQPGHRPVDRRRCPVAVRLPVGRQERRRRHQERPVPGHAPSGRRARAEPPVRVLRLLVLGQGQPEGGARVGLDVRDPGAVQPPSEPGSHGQPGHRGVRHRVVGYGRSSGGFRAGEGVPDRHHRRRHGALDHQRPGGWTRRRG